MKVGELRQLCAAHPGSRLRLINLASRERRDVEEIISCPSFADHLALVPKVPGRRDALTSEYAGSDLDHYLKSGIHTPRHGMQQIFLNTPVWVATPNGSLLQGVVGHRIGRGFLCLLTAKVDEY